ncbi:hypothetical protein ACFL0L_05510 [Patescibacteria group bacterium]
MLVALGLVIFFMYLTIIQKVVRLAKTQEDLSLIDTDSDAGKRKYQQRRAERFALAGAFTKGILWVCMYVLFGMLIEPWHALTTFVIFNLSLFVTLLVKDSSERGRKGLWTIGHLLEAFQIAGLAAVCIFITFHYWNVGLRKVGGPHMAEFLDNIGYAAQVVTGKMTDWAPNALKSETLQQNRFELADRNSDGFIDGLDTAFAIADINGSGGMPDTLDLEAFSMYYVLDTSLGPNARGWNLYVAVGPHDQPVGDCNGDLMVTLEDSVYLHQYLHQGGRPPIFQRQTAFIPADYPTQASAQDGSTQYAASQPARHPDIDRRSRDLARASQQQQRPNVVAVAPLPQAPPVQNFTISAKEYHPVKIGPVRAGSTIKIEAVVIGVIRFGPHRIFNRFSDVRGAIDWQVKLSPNDDLGRKVNGIDHGALCLLVPDPFSKGKQEVQPLNWRVIGTDRNGAVVCIATFTAPMDGEYGLRIEDSDRGGYSNNGGVAEATVTIS